MQTLICPIYSNKLQFSDGNSNHPIISKPRVFSGKTIDLWNETIDLPSNIVELFWENGCFQANVSKHIQILYESKRSTQFRNDPNNSQKQGIMTPHPLADI